VSTDTIHIDTPPPLTTSRARTKARTTRFGSEAIQFPLFVWLIHWLITQIPATLAYHYGTQRPDTYDSAGQLLRGTSWAYGGNPEWNPEPLSGLAKWLVEPMRLWDGSWYRLVSVFDYNAGMPALAAYFPAYPTLMRWGADLTGMSAETIGYIISNLTFLGALFIVYRIVALDFDDSIARKTLWALALFPTSFFFTAVYTESLFFILAAGALYAARRQQWWIAGLIGILAALTRSAGVMLLAPFAVLFLQQYGWNNPRRWFPNAIPAAFPVLGLAAYSWYLTHRGMKYDDWITQQWQWNRFSAMPWRTFDCTLNGCTADVRQFGNTSRDFPVAPIDWGWIGDLIRHPTWSHFTSYEWRDRMANSDVLEFVITILAFALVLIGLRKLPLYYTAFVVPPLLVPLFSPSSVHPLMSMPRFVLPLFPLFVVIALLIKDRRVGWVVAGISTVLLVLLTMQFAQWYWVA